MEVGTLCRYTGTTHRDYTNELVRTSWELLDGNWVVSVANVDVTVEGGGTWGIEFACKLEELVEVEKENEK